MHIIRSFSFELHKHWWIWHKPKTEISQLYMDKIVEWIFFHFKSFFVLIYSKFLTKSFGCVRNVKQQSYIIMYNHGSYVYFTSNSAEIK